MNTKINNINCKPKISILITIYNVEKYLKECLDSVINQTWKDIEIICINDGSTDSCAEILNAYSLKDNRIKVINKENSGYGASMNMGLEEATGDYIGIVESDDFIKEEMFANLYEIATKDDAEIVKSDYFYYVTSTKQKRKAGKISKIRSNKVITVKDYPKLLKMQPSIWSAIYKRDFLNNNKIRFLETPGASYQDTSFSFKALTLANKIILTNKAYLYYRQDNENSSVQSKDKIFIICNEYDEITNFLNNNLKIKKHVNTHKLIKQYKAYMWNLKRIDEKHRDSFIEVFSNTFKEYYDANELDSKFYKKFGKKKIELLISNKTQFRECIEKLIEEEKTSSARRKLFSVRINPSRASVTLFGKKIMEIW